MKQLKSSLGDLRKLFEHSITVRDISEPLVSFDAERPTHDIKEIMEQSDFDVVGVRQRGVMIGFVCRSEMDQATNRIHSFQEAHLLSESDSIITAITRLGDESRFRFVTILGQVGGIVTRGDMQKAPVRMWLFGLISLIEMQMLRIVRKCYPDGSWDRWLRPNRRTRAFELLQLRQGRNEAIDLADCLQFCDKRDIILKTEKLRERFASIHLIHPDQSFRDLETLRNELAHGQDIIGGDFARMARIAKCAEEMLDILEKS